MPQVTLNFTTKQLTRLIAAEVGLNPIPTQPDTDPPVNVINPQTRQPFTEAQWTRRCVIQRLRQTVFKWERQVAVQAALASVDLDSEIGS